MHSIIIWGHGIAYSIASHSTLSAIWRWCERRCYTIQIRRTVKQSYDVRCRGIQIPTESLAIHDNSCFEPCACRCALAKMEIVYCVQTYTFHLQGEVHWQKSNSNLWTTKTYGYGEWSTEGAQVNMSIRAKRTSKRARALARLPKSSSYS